MLLGAASTGQQKPRLGSVVPESGGLVPSLAFKRIYDLGFYEAEGPNPSFLTAGGKPNWSLWESGSSSYLTADGPGAPCGHAPLRCSLRSCAALLHAFAWRPLVAFLFGVQTVPSGDAGAVRYSPWACGRRSLSSTPMKRRAFFQVMASNSSWVKPIDANMFSSDTGLHMGKSLPNITRSIP